MFIEVARRRGLVSLLVPSKHVDSVSHHIVLLCGTPRNLQALVRLWDEIFFLALLGGCRSLDRRLFQDASANHQVFA